MGLGTAPAALVGYLGATVRADLGLSAQALGLVASTFYGATGVALLGTGPLCDRLGARWCTLIAVGAEAAALGVVAGVRTYPALEAGAALCGVGYALTNVGTTVAVAEVSAPDRVGLLLATKTAGVPALATVVALGGPPLATHIGWTGVAAVLAVVIAVLSVPVLIWFPDAAPRHAGSAQLAPTRPSLPPRFWLLALAPFLMIAGSQPLLSWFALYVHDRFDLAVSTAGDIAAVGSSTSIVMLLVVATVTGRLRTSRLAVVVACACAICGAAVLAIGSGPSLGVPPAVVAATVGLWMNLVAAGMTQAVVVERVRDGVGRATGIAMSGYYGGALVAPFGFGLLRDATGGYATGWFVAAGTLALASCAYLQVQRQVPITRVGAPAVPEVPIVAAEL